MSWKMKRAIGFAMCAAPFVLILGGAVATGGAGAIALCLVLGVAAWICTGVWLATTEKDAA